VQRNKSYQNQSNDFRADSHYISKLKFKVSKKTFAFFLVPIFRILKRAEEVKKLMIRALSATSTLKTENE